MLVFVGEGPNSSGSAVNIRCVDADSTMEDVEMTIDERRHLKGESEKTPCLQLY